MRTITRYGIGIVTGAVLIVQPVVARAAGVFDEALKKFLELDVTRRAQTDIDFVIADIILTGLSLVGVIFFVLMIYGGFLWMTARGDSPQIEKAKQTITSAIIGLAITLGAYAIAYFVVQAIEAASGIS
ncbi:MAG: hypothetical protein Q7S96_04925 [bacterium]|nr:hypothetical protein [bacterium]